MNTHCRSALSSSASEQTGGTCRIDDKACSEFVELLRSAKRVAVLTGAGISAASGIPTFRGAGGLWRTWSATEIATPEAFAADPSLVWEFYHYRRKVVSEARPNAGHAGLERLQRWCEQQHKEFTLITQNIDRLHQAARSTNVVELHGSVWLTRCVRCGDVRENRDMPICPALEGRGSPEPQAPRAPTIPMEHLPRCTSCQGLLRPHVVWFGENLEEQVLQRANGAVEACDLFIVVGTSAVVYPAAGFARLAKALGATVAEFNLEQTDNSEIARFCFHGDSSQLLPLVVSKVVKE